MADPVEVLRVLGNKFSAEILHAADEPKSAQEFSDELDIPMATSYRRIEELTDLELLESVGQEFSDEGRRTRMYRRRIDTLMLDFGGERIEVDWDERPDEYDPLTDIWRSLGSQ